MAMIDETKASFAPAFRHLGPEKWHCFAAQWNDWNAGVEYLDWIVRQPDCERATAQLIFWKGNPDHYIPEKGSESDDHEARERASDVFRMLKVIAENWTSGFYKSNRLSGLIYSGEHQGQSYFEYPVTGEIFGIKSILEGQDPGGEASSRPADRLKGLFVPLAEPSVLREMRRYREREEDCEPHRLPWIIPDSIGQVLSGDPVEITEFNL
jgi:Domain of unknown function (DUF4274)